MPALMIEILMFLLQMKEKNKRGTPNLCITYHLQLNCSDWFMICEVLDRILSIHFADKATLTDPSA